MLLLLQVVVVVVVAKEKSSNTTASPVSRALVCPPTVIVIDIDGVVGDVASAAAAVEKEGFAPLCWSIIKNTRNLVFVQPFFILNDAFGCRTRKLALPRL